MAVLVEAISVIIKGSSLETTYRGGVRAFAKFCRQINNTFCSDGELVRVGFIEAEEAKRFVEKLSLFGIVHIRGGLCVDLVVADQRGGLMSPCDWATFGLAELPGGPQVKVAACRLVGSTIQDLTVPDSWRFETSISSKVPAAPVMGPARGKTESGVLASPQRAAVPIAQRLGLRPIKT